MNVRERLLNAAEALERGASCNCHHVAAKAGEGAAARLLRDILLWMPPSFYESPEAERLLANAEGLPDPPAGAARN